MKTGTKIGLLALALAFGTVALWSYLIRQVSIPEDKTAFIVAFVSAAVLGVTALVKGTSLPGAVPAVLAVFIGCLLPFTMSIAPQVVVVADVIKVGDTLPHFTAPDDRGQIFDSKSLYGHLVLIKFFRAHW